jgi:signal transduction histidine kinase
VTGADLRLEPYLEVFIFRAIQELLGNTALYSMATQVKVQISIDEQNTRVNVEDNGKGFDTSELTDAKGLGLKIIQERVGMLNGNIEIDSVVGQGTRTNIQIPTILNDMK